jgi:putative endonuclease
LPIFSSLIFGAVRWAARKGLRGELDDVSEEQESPEEPGFPERKIAQNRFAARKLVAGRTGMRGETYAYWYLRRNGYVFVARNYMPRGAKGEIDLIGYDGKTLAFVEVRTRTVRDALTALPELSVTTDKQRVVVRTARRFLGERHVGDCPCRFDVLAIDNRRGRLRTCGCTRMRLVRRCLGNKDRHCRKLVRRACSAHNFTKTHPYKPRVGHPQEIVRLLFFEVV